MDAWLRSVLWDNVLPGHDAGAKETALPFEMHRLKGRLVLEDGSEKMVQGVRELFEIFDNEASSSSSLAKGKMVLIGRHLTEFDFQASLLNTITRA